MNIQSLPCVQRATGILTLVMYKSQCSHVYWSACSPLWSKQSNQSFKKTCACHSSRWLYFYQLQVSIFFHQKNEYWNNLTLFNVSSSCQLKSLQNSWWNVFKIQCISPHVTAFLPPPHHPFFKMKFTLKHHFWTGFTSVASKWKTPPWFYRVLVLLLVIILTLGIYTALLCISTLRLSRKLSTMKSLIESLDLTFVQRMGSSLKAWKV